MKDIFRIAPVPAGSIWIIGLTALLILALAGLILYFGLLGRQTTFQVNNEHLTITGWPYGRSLAIKDLNLTSAKIVDLNNSEYKPTVRSNGVGLPGYKLGWFKLMNKEKALVFVTNTSNVVHIETNEGYSLLLSPENPKEMLASLSN